MIIAYFGKKYKRETVVVSGMSSITEQMKQIICDSKNESNRAYNVGLLSKQYSYRRLVTWNDRNNQEIVVFSKLYTR